MSGWKRRMEKKKFENTSSTWSNLIWRHKETSSTREIGEDVFFHEKTLVGLRQRLPLSSHRILYPSDTHTPDTTAWLASRHHLFDFFGYIKSLRVIEFRELCALTTELPTVVHDVQSFYRVSNYKSPCQLGIVSGRGKKYEEQLEIDGDKMGRL